jgi:hypothetical protein
MRSHTLPVRVYLEDTDAQGFVYNASYLRFMERARTEWLRDRGIDHEALRDSDTELYLVLSAIELRFVRTGAVERHAVCLRRGYGVARRPRGVRARVSAACGRTASCCAAGLPRSPAWMPPVAGRRMPGGNHQ